MTRRALFRTATTAALAAAVAAALCGCGGGDRGFRLNYVYLKKQENLTHTTLTAEQQQDIRELLARWFGTPDAARLPDLPGDPFGALVERHVLEIAAGPVASDEQGRPRGLYREHCALCHGLNGDGIGPTASFLDPYPRDFRRGLFKFKTTPDVTPPTDADLQAVLARGVPGTAMPSFRLVGRDDRTALIHYVKYLSFRGEVERGLIFESVDQLEPQDRLVDFSLADSRPTKLEEQLAALEPLVTAVARRWTGVAAKVLPVPPRPANGDLAVSIAHGRELFFGAVANCVKCHGQTAQGEGQTEDYDEWAKEIIDLQNPAAVQQYVACGALPPRKIRPRNLRDGVYRGGGTPADLYRRIWQGIAGTPMPAAPLQPDTAAAQDKRLTWEDLWSLVDYVQQLPSESPPVPAPSGLASATR